MLKKMFMCLLAMVCLLSINYSNVYAGATITEVDYDKIFFVECSEEYVHFTGKLHHVVNTSTDGNDCVHFRVHTNTKGIHGEGLSTGDEYVFSSSQTRVQKLCGGPPWVYTYTSRFKIINKDNDENNDTLYHFHAHITINPNGETTIEYSNGWSECF